MQERLSFVATFVVLTATLRIICICLYTGIRQDVPYDIYVYIYIYIGGLLMAFLFFLYLVFLILLLQLIFLSWVL